MSEISESDLAVIESQLKGKTLLVYWHLLRSQSSRVGVRAIQRSLGFSSPSVAAHHLDKLLSLGLVEKSMTGEYFLGQEVRVGLLRFFTRLGRFLVPDTSSTPFGSPPCLSSIWHSTGLPVLFTTLPRSFLALYLTLSCGLKPLGFGERNHSNLCTRCSKTWT